MTERQWLALGALGVGAVNLLGALAFAKGRAAEGFAITATTTIVASTIAAAKLLGPDPMRTGP